MKCFEFTINKFLMVSMQFVPCIYFNHVFQCNISVECESMGCSAGKFETYKVKDSPVFAESDVKIQTVLKLNPVENKLHKSSKTDGRNRKHKRSDSKCSKSSENRRKSPKPSNDRIVKSTYDPKIIAKYDMKAIIGKGSYSRVLRVENRLTKQPYALKVIEAPNGYVAFEAELGVLRRLNHSNVIKLYEVFESNCKVYMVMELATGGSLLDRLEERGCLSEEDSRVVMRMVLRGVEYLHALGITHRDLKPDNLLYYHPGKESKIMITDFSFASSRKPSGNPYMHTICGTPQYVAPEIVTRKPYTCLVDMWAVGIITYIVLCGIFPFDAEQDSQIFKLILRGKVQMTDQVWSEVSEEGKSFVFQLLCADPARRPCARTALALPWLSSSSRSSSSPGRGGDRRSLRSVGSARSRGSSSIHSIRASGHRRIQAHQLDELRSDPELAGII